MRLYRVRFDTRAFGELMGLAPSCLVVLQNEDRFAMLSILRTAFKDDPLLTKEICDGHIEVKEIPLDREGVY